MSDKMHLYNPIVERNQKGYGGVFMHMADALLSPAVATTMYVASGAVAAYSIKKLREDDEQSKLPVMAVTAAVVFAG